MPRISWDSTRCQASGECTVVAPHLFDLDDDLILKFDPEQPEAELETLRQAVLRCPTGALQFEQS